MNGLKKGVVKMANKKITIEYNIENAPVGSNSATEYLAMHLGPKSFSKTDFKDITLIVQNMTTQSNLQMLKAFIEDLIYLERMGVQVILSNTFE